LDFSIWISASIGSSTQEQPEKSSDVAGESATVPEDWEKLKQLSHNAWS